MTRPVQRVASKLTQFPIDTQLQSHRFPRYINHHLTTSGVIPKSPLLFAYIYAKFSTICVSVSVRSSVLRLSLPTATAKYYSYCGVHLLFSSFQVNTSYSSLYKCLNLLALHKLFSKSCESCLPQLEKFNGDSGCLKLKFGCLLARILLCEGSAQL